MVTRGKVLKALSEDGGIERMAMSNAAYHPIIYFNPDENTADIMYIPTLGGIPIVSPEGLYFADKKDAHKSAKELRLLLWGLVPKD